jgi:hypothetical protein
MSRHCRAMLAAAYSTRSSPRQMHALPRRSHAWPSCRLHSLKGPRAVDGNPAGRTGPDARQGEISSSYLGGRSRRRAPSREIFQMTHNRSFKTPFPIPNFGHSFIAAPELCAPISSWPRRRQGGLTNRQPSVVSFKFQLSGSSSAMILPASAKAVFAAGTPA